MTRASLGVALSLAVSQLGAGSPALAAAPPPALAGPTLAVNASLDRHAISPDIYGVSFADRATAKQTGITVNRFGGNATSRFNYRNDSYNTGSDYFYENIPATLGGQTDDDLLFRDGEAGLKTWLTVPTIGWVAKSPPVYDHPFPCGFPRTAFPSQDAFDPYDSNCGNGRHNGADIPGASATSTSQAVDTLSWVKAEAEHLKLGYGGINKGGVTLYGLDNEPALWNHTHRDVHPDPLTFTQYAQAAIAGARGVKQGNANALTSGPADWGWCAYLYSPSDAAGCGDGPDRASHGGKSLAAFFLAQMKAASDTDGVRLLDYFDEHYYPQAGGVALQGAGSAATQALRLRTTRSLWDPAYIDESWISDTAPGGVAVRLIPRMRNWVAANFPGTKLAIGEYDFGGLESLNGALTQADVLGIFAREGVDLAALWAPGAPNDPWAFAFRMYRNADGKGGRFGDTWIRSTSADQSKLAIYGAQRGPAGSLTLMVINKTSADLTSSVSLAGFTPDGPVHVYRYSGADLNEIARPADVAVTGGSVSTTYPASSITLLVIPPHDTAPPTVTLAPQPGLPGDISFPGPAVTISWSAATDDHGVESYQMQQRIDSGAFGAFPLGVDATSTRVDWAATPSAGHRYTFRVRARDGAGNVSSWVTGPEFRLRLVQDTAGSIAYSAGWSEKVDGSASGGTVHVAPGSGTPTATLSFSARAVAFMTRRGFPAPEVEVDVDGKRIALRSLESITGFDFPTLSRQVLVAETWPATGSHTMTIKGPDVPLDAFLLIDTP